MVPRPGCLKRILLRRAAMIVTTTFVKIACIPPPSLIERVRPLRVITCSHYVSESGVSESLGVSFALSDHTPAIAEFL